VQEARRIPSDKNAETGANLLLVKIGVFEQELHDSATAGFHSYESLSICEFRKEAQKRSVLWHSSKCRSKDRKHPISLSKLSYKNYVIEIPYFVW
jgi:hypothetical protein